ncbi:CBS domain-containing protein [Streptomyces sp. Je 1-369]|uniref:CBS domain-containing protein n=1 Tax=Streptomyces sp. Je 1-369 TaxID=2966192 RepID=UPI0022861023|nr:CBS domain-containing protein [Streptomyces sp. Je 1-369]WAL93540.1 CBS domain-containing protein [Streptomyces sp. Je 1-369]
MSGDPVRGPSADTVVHTVAHAVEEAGRRVWDDMTVEVALSVMDGARVGHLLVRDEDGRRTGLVTRARLTAVRDSSAYTDRIRLRDLSDADLALALALAH